MLEVDLLRGSGWSRERMPSLRLLGGRGTLLDPWVGGAAATIALSLGLAAHLILPLRKEMAAAEGALEDAVADSARAAALALTVRAVEARRDSIAAKVAMIRSIDAHRYLWPRILSQVADALPPGAWLTHLGQVDAPRPATRFQVEGVAPDNLSLTRFWDALESATSIAGVSLLSTEVVETPSGRGHFFVLQADEELSGGARAASPRPGDGR